LTEIAAGDCEIGAGWAVLHEGSEKRQQEGTIYRAPYSGPGPSKLRINKPRPLRGVVQPEVLFGNVSGI